MNLPRLVSPPTRPFFLFGPRGVGKSTLLAGTLPHAKRFDLLDSHLFLQLGREPHLLSSLLGDAPKHSWVILDEVQKIPALLDEVHKLIEDRGLKFALCGSSARKLKRGGANLLAGRASTVNLEGFSAGELGESFNLQQALDWGTLPLVHNEPSAAGEILSAYVNTYLREELMAEGLIRQTPPFLRFLQLAGHLNGQQLNGLNISREAAIARSTLDSYLSILEETLITHPLPAWRPGFKVRERSHPKLYWFDPGVARAAAGLHQEPPDRLWRGTALETLVFHELRVYHQMHRRSLPIFYYRTPSGVEVDFVVEVKPRGLNKPGSVVAIEVKLAERWDSSFSRSLKQIRADLGDGVHRLIGVYTGSHKLTQGEVTIYPFGEFVRDLLAGKIY